MFRRRSTRPPPGEFPPGFTESFMRRSLPTASPAQAEAAVDHLRKKGWSEERLEKSILPFMPRPPRDGAAESSGIPPGASSAWLDRHLPGMDREQIAGVVDELERRGWSAADVAVAVLPHLLPKLPRADADAVLAGLVGIGLPPEEIARLARWR